MHAVTGVVAGPVKVKRALISVSDKTGVVEFARELAKMGVMIISTGGTAKALEAAGVRCTPIEEVTGLPEMMDGRVKTLHPAVHGALLAVRDNPEHAAALRQHRIEPIDLVCINLYPFEATVAKPGVSRAEAIENIDIGGPSMIRSAAKNHAYVAVATRVGHYQWLLEGMKKHDGCTTPQMRQWLAVEAFAVTASYDGAINKYLLGATLLDVAAAERPPATVPAEHAATEVLPATMTLHFDKVQEMRYGENPHQKAALYRSRCDVAPGILTARQFHGKELGYNNVADAAAAQDLARALSEQVNWRGVGTAVMKHANPCGAAVAGTSADSIRTALAGDPVAAFGGILATTHEITDEAAALLCAKEVFLEVIIARSFSAAGVEMLKAKSVNMRLLAAGELRGTTQSPMMLRTIPGGALLQERDLLPPDVSQWKHMAGPKPTAETLEAAAVVEVMVRGMSSNAIAIGGRDGTSTRLFGGGVGQVDRVTACRLAVEKARQFSAGLMETGAGIAVSDAFFPFPDGPRMLIDGGVKTIVHPGGSKRDGETFEVCEKAGVTCLVTGVRRFRH